MTENKSVLTRLRRFVDGEADTPFEYFMLFVVIANAIVLGLETSPELTVQYGKCSAIWKMLLCHRPNLSLDFYN